jgi:hypothetical protein
MRNNVKMSLIIACGAGLLQACAVFPVSAPQTMEELVRASNDPKPGFVAGNPGMSGGAFRMNTRTLQLPDEALRSVGVKLENPISRSAEISTSRKKEIFDGIDALGQIACEFFVLQHTTSECPTMVRADAFVLPAARLPITNR